MTNSKTLKVTLAAMASLLIAAANAADEKRQPVQLIFDTDIGNDVDDVLALGMIHALQTRGECDLLGVTITKDHDECAPFVDAVNTFYGRGDIPIGITSSGVTPAKSKFTGLAHAMNGSKPRYPHDLTDAKAHDAVKLLRELLAAADDNSVVIVQVGFSTNVAGLLASKPDDNSPMTGRDLAAKKVKLLSVMAGAFELIRGKPHHEYNVIKDIKSAKLLANEWPTPIVYSGFEIGLAIPYPAESILSDYNYVDHHPLSEAYHLYNPPPHNRPTWDLTSVLHAVRPSSRYFTLSPVGRVTVTDKGLTEFKEDPNGRHQFLKADSHQRARVEEALILLSSQPPQRK